MGCETILDWNASVRLIRNLHCVLHVVLFEEWRLSPSYQVQEIHFFMSVTRRKNLPSLFFNKLKIYHLSSLLILVLLSGWNSAPYNVERGAARKWHIRCGKFWWNRWSLFGKDQPLNLFWACSRWVNCSSMNSLFICRILVLPPVHYSCSWL